MIAYLNGKIDHLEPAHVIIECNGVGYRVRISLNTFSELQGKSQIKLHTYLQVREDAQTLYGFFDPNEQSLFEQLISISGVGANTAITILSSVSPDELFQAISSEDTMALKQIKGIGPKTAGRIILELKDKIKMEGESVAGGKGVASDKGRIRQEALVALAQLGFPRSTMDKRLDRLFKEHGEGLTVEKIIKMALRNP